MSTAETVYNREEMSGEEHVELANKMYAEGEEFRDELLALNDMFCVSVCWNDDVHGTVYIRIKCSESMDCDWTVQDICRIIGDSDIFAIFNINFDARTIRCKHVHNGVVNMMKARE